MNAIRRLLSGVVVLGTILATATVYGQALNQLPAGAVGVIKVNNVQAVSTKIKDLAAKMNITALAPPLADPLGSLQQQLGIKGGLDPKGDLVVGIYMPVEGSEVPRVVVLVPVTDYKAFAAGLPEAKEQGNLTVFSMPGEAETFYAAKFGDYAAISPIKEFLAQAPAGINIAGLAGKELNSNDIVAYVDLKTLGAMGLPLIKGSRTQIVDQAEKELKQIPNFNQKFAPVVRALMEQALNVVEGTLASAQAATIGLNFSNQGIATNCIAQFDPNSYFGKALQQMKPAQGNLLAGLPAGKYFAFGGFATNPAVSTKLFDDFVGPISQQLANAGAEGKPILAMMDAMRVSLAATDRAAAGYVMPTGAPGQQSLMQEVVVYHGDAQKIYAATKQSYDAMTDLFKLLPQVPGATMSFTVKPEAMTVDGVKLDEFAMNMKFDPNAPEGARDAQVMAMIYGGNGMTGHMGPVDDKTFLLTAGAPAELVKAAVAAAKNGDTALSDAAPVKAVAAQLPSSGSMVLYVALDNILDTTQQYLKQMGMPVNLKLPPNLPPIGFSAGAEESAIRMNSFLPSDLIENLVAAGLQMFMQAQPAPKGGL